MKITSENVYQLLKQLEAKVKEENDAYEVYTNFMKEAYLMIDELRDHLNNVRFDIARIAEKLLPIMRVAVTHYEEENADLLRGSNNAK